MSHTLHYSSEWEANNDDANVWIKKSDGSLQSFPDHNKLPEFVTQASRDCKLVHIEAWTISCPIVYFDKDFVSESDRKDVNYKYMAPETGYHLKIIAGVDRFMYVAVHFD